MPATKIKTFKVPKTRPVVGSLGIADPDPMKLVQMIRAGFPFSRLARFQKATALPWEKIARFVSIPQRTLTRRQQEGRLRPDESDRVWRAAGVFDHAVQLFLGNVEGARQWLQRPQLGLGGQIPIEFAATEVGAQEVRNLITRIQHGVFS